MSEPIIDTSTPLATPTPERRPAAGWRGEHGQWWLSIPNAPAMRVYKCAADLTWRWHNADEDAPPKDDPICESLAAAQIQAEDAAARLLLAALAELPDARRLMAESLAGREGR